MSLPRLAVHHVVLMNLLFWVFIGVGVVFLNRIPIDVYPDTSLDIAEITTIWLGASSEEVERLVTRKIEEEIEDLPGADRVISVSQPDASIITVKFREDIGRLEFEAAFDDLRTRMDRVSGLPEGAEEPRLQRLTTDEVMPLVQVGVLGYAELDETVLRRVAIRLRDEIRQLPGVAKVGMIGDREREVHILVDKDKLEKHNLSMQQVAAVLRASNLNMPAGHLPIGDTEITLRSVGEVDDPQDYGNVCVVRSPTGAHVHLRDMARIEETFERAIWAARINGRPAIILQVSKERHANSLVIREQLADCIDDYLARLTVPGVDVQVQADSTAIIASRLGVLKNNLGVGILLVFGVLWIAVGWRNALLAIVGIPFAFLCAVIFMGVIGVSLNAVSVFSLVLVSGMIVDDAIVVLENIYHHVQAGKPVHEAVVVGTEEVLWPVISSTLTTVMAFLPLLLMTGVLGSFFSIVPKTVAVALVASLFECLLILPVHYLDWGPRSVQRGASRAADPWTTGWRGRMTELYDRSIAQVLACRYLSPVVLGACLLFAWQAQRTLTVEMFPPDFPTFVVDFNAKPGSSLAATTREVARFASVIDQFTPDKVLRSSSAVGVQINEDTQRVMRTDVAQMWIDVSGGTSRGDDPVKVINEVREALNAFLLAHPDSGIESLRVWPIKDGPPVGKPVAIRVEHPDYDVARGIVDQIKEQLRATPGVYDVADNLQLGNRELVLRLEEERASELGVTFLDVANAYRGAQDGLQVGIYKDTVHDDDLDIKLRYDQASLASVDALPNIRLVGASGSLVELGQVARLDFEQSYTNRFHYDSKRAVEVTANVDTNVTDARIVNEAIIAEFGPLAERDDTLQIISGGQFAETQASFASLRGSAVIALGLMYLIMAAQFRSYTQPAVIMAAVVFGVLGMVIGLVVNGYPFSVVTGIAMVGLCGVVVNDALVLIDFINVHRRSGASLEMAIREGCRRRLRPILLTTITTVVGLMPMALGVGGYSKIWSPFAMSMCWGLVFATLLTLLLVPALYYISEEVSELLRRVLRRRPAADDAAVASSVTPTR